MAVGNEKVFTACLALFLWFGPARATFPSWPTLAVRGNTPLAMKTFCHFPFVYQGQIYYTCVTLNVTSSSSKNAWCATTENYDVDHKWGFCLREVPTFDGGSLGANSFCEFPFTHSGREHYSCVEEAGQRPWCATSASRTSGDGQWGYCVRPARSSYGTAEADVCVFPNNNGDDNSTSYTCFPGSPYSWCLDTNGRWGYCGGVSAGKKAYQSGSGTTANLVTDGQYAKYTIFESSCSHTSIFPEPTPWWAVDLEKAYAVNSVWIMTYGGSGIEMLNLDDNLKKVTVEVGWHLNPNDMSLRSFSFCAYHHDVIPLSSASNTDGTHLNCTTPDLPGRYVIIHLADSAVLGLCEVTVMGKYLGDIIGSEQSPVSPHEISVTYSSTMNNMTVLFPSGQTFRNDGVIVAWIYYAETLKTIHFQIWREKLSPVYYLIAAFHFTPTTVGYQYVSMNASFREGDVWVQRGDTIGISFVEPSARMELTTCSYTDINGEDRRRQPFLHAKQGPGLAGQATTFTDDGRCVAHFIEAVVQYSACKSAPCMNNATCIEVPDSVPESYFRCGCEDGFTGFYCEKEIDECDSSPCLAEETCEDLFRSYTCHVPSYSVVLTTATINTPQKTTGLEDYNHEYSTVAISSTQQSSITSNDVTTTQSSTRSNGVMATRSSITSNDVTTTQSSITSNGVTTQGSITSNDVTTTQSSITSNGVTPQGSITSNDVTTTQSSITSNGVTTTQNSITSNDVTTYPFSTESISMPTVKTTDSDSQEKTETDAPSTSNVHDGLTTNDRHLIVNPEAEIPVLSLRKIFIQNLPVVPPTKATDPDDRLSAKLLGTTGIIFLIMEFSLILYLDLHRCFE